MKKITVKQITTAAILAALAIVLDYLSFRTDFTKVTLYSLPLLMAGIFCGPVVGLLAGLVEGFISQAICYGFSATTPLWMLAPMCWGLFSGLIFKAFKKPEHYQIGLAVAVIATSLIVTLVNTGCSVLDGIIYKYPYAYVFTSIGVRIGTSIALACIYTALFILVYPRLNNFLSSKKEITEN